MAKWLFIPLLGLTIYFVVSVIHSSYQKNFDDQQYANIVRDSLLVLGAVTLFYGIIITVCRNAIHKTFWLIMTLALLTLYCVFAVIYSGKKWLESLHQANIVRDTELVVGAVTLFYGIMIACTATM